MSGDAYETVHEILERRGMKREARVDAIIEALSVYDDVYEVAPNKTHVAVETVNAYGLVIGVDANGYASLVTFPNGARIVTDE